MADGGQRAAAAVERKSRRPGCAIGDIASADPRCSPQPAAHAIVLAVNSGWRTW